jgi:hypothetical protein
MTVRRAANIIGILVWTAVALTAWPHGRSPRALALTMSARPDEMVASCAELHVTFDHQEAVVQSEERTITKADAPTLRVAAESNGGVQIQGWDGDAYSVTLCKAVEAGRDAETRLGQIHLSFEGGQLGVVGPSSHDRWSGHLLIRAPKAATLEVVAKNGPLSVHNVNGQVKVRSQNGPVTISGCSGELDLTAQNGPLTLEGNRGKQMVSAQNGPVNVSLSGDAWEGEGLEAHATNGPIRLEIPSGYRSGVVLESEGRSPFECNGAVCSEGRRTWDDEHKRMEFGASPAVVRVSTVNGPVSVN